MLTYGKEIDFPKKLTEKVFELIILFSSHY